MDLVLSKAERMDYGRERPLTLGISCLLPLITPFVMLPFWACSVLEALSWAAVQVPVTCTSLANDCAYFWSENQGVRRMVGMADRFVASSMVAFYFSRSLVYLEPASIVLLSAPCAACFYMSNTCEPGSFCAWHSCWHACLGASLATVMALTIECGAHDGQQLA